MKKISIKTSHNDYTNTDYYRSFDLLDYDDDLPEGIAKEVKPDPDDHNSIWSEYPGLVLWEIIEPGGGVRYVARPEGRYSLFVDTGCVTELFDDRDAAMTAYQHRVDAGESCNLYDNKLHEEIASFDPDEGER